MRHRVPKSARQPSPSFLSIASPASVKRFNALRTTLTGSPVERDK